MLSASLNSCVAGRYLPDQNLIFDTDTQLVYANIGTAQSHNAF
jgi:hypothetical protein